jgi:hypothetical protein
MKTALTAICCLTLLNLFTACSRTVYVEVPVPVEVKPKPKPKPTPRPKPRMDNPDNFDAVTKPTTYS